jgi:biotin operon repressor
VTSGNDIAAAGGIDAYRAQNSPPMTFTPQDYDTYMKNVGTIVGSGALTQEQAFTNVAKEAQRLRDQGYTIDDAELARSVNAQFGTNFTASDVGQFVTNVSTGASDTGTSAGAGVGTSAGAGVGTNVTTGGTGPLATGNREGPDALVSNVTTQAGSTPSLPAGTKVTTEDITVDPTNEIIADITSLGDVTTTTKTAATPDAVSDPTETTYSDIGTTTAAENVTDATAATSDSPLAGALISDEDVAQGTVSDQSIVTAAQGTVSQEATVQYQIGELMASIKAGQPLPAWAAGAARGATQVMQQRGLGASSMASAAMIQSLMEAGIPIAAADAQTYAAMDIANLNNKQQAVLQNAATYAAMDRANLDVRAQAQQSNARAFLSIDLQSLTNKQKTNELNYQGELQAILTDAAAENATAQFNAKNKVQIDQFFAELGVQVDNANANRKAAVDQFNVSEANAMTQFTEALNDARERFSSQMQLQVDQSNAQWRRDINTANTAATNEANRINAQNLLNINQQALNNLWQRYRDEAAWAVQMAENANQRAHQVGILAMENQYNTELYETQFQNEALLALGQTATELVYGIYKES